MMRLPTEVQKMPDLPMESLSEQPPFTYSGMDMYGHFLISTGTTTRARKGTTKIRTLLITCLAAIAIQIEALPSCPLCTLLYL